MIKVRGAQFRRVLDRGGKAFAEVEVFTDQSRDPQMLAYFRAGSDGTYPLVRLMSNDADYEVDWFDNNLHSAFDDVTIPTFSTPDHLGITERDEFAAQIKAYPGIAEALDRNLNPT
jgi:hypothetical protein